MNPIITIIEKMSSIAGRIAGYLMIPLTLIVVYTIIMRRFLHDAPDWGFEVPIFIYGISILLAGAEVLRVKGHIAVDIIPRLLSPGWNKVFGIFAMLLVIFVTTFLIYRGSIMAIESTMIMEHSSHQSSFNPQIWWFKWFIPLSGFLIWLQAWAEIYKIAKGGYTDDSAI
ncbi:hypothetical protein SporoP37_02335 [Sporosarcina sp. P37]|uniref:TRAP transporter small permease subunit n=1 Tax=unclassified Sporosarcina TaxID=2647733 RepID=UPI0009BE4484|nr:MULTISPECIES: TRAP transporter small permease [unclassified Sporosarcina]ARD47095.1 hypothetical protein SporoP33_01760 [Sporosarcina sp. P33]ARK23643.1 hypothetical protein SporoP37_02335 [Sporosarcina sp. P37]PID18733.1 TRAP transporter small permease [Sporosarcina sp. P35]